MVDAVMAKLTENFARQPAVLQEAYLTRMLAIKGALYRSVPAEEHKAADMHCLIYTHLVAALFTFFIRPKAVSPQDKVICF